MSETKIKKAYAAIVEFLQQNAEAVVGDILPNVIELAQAKTGSGGGKATTFHRDEAGVVVAVECYYHKLWMDPRVAEFGEKKASASGYNSMCKDGQSKWSKQNRDLKSAKESILSEVQAGELDFTDIGQAIEDAEAASKEVTPREDGYGFATLEECLADSAERGME